MECCPEKSGGQYDNWCFEGKLVDDVCKWLAESKNIAENTVDFFKGNLAYRGVLIYYFFQFCDLQIEADMDGEAILAALDLGQEVQQ